MKKQDLKEGKIHIYAGDGKGKTTAAIGLSVRAAGYGYRVLFSQFLKDGQSSEIKILENISQIEVLQAQAIKKFVFAMNQQEKIETKQITEEYFAKLIIRLEEKKTDVLILDEILGAISTGMLAEEKLLEFLKNKPKNLEVVLTGRDPSPDLIKLTDYYSKIEAVKHPYQTEHLKARQGIEF